MDYAVQQPGERFNQGGLTGCLVVGRSFLTLGLWRYFTVTADELGWRQQILPGAMNCASAPGTQRG